jgi:hypothetical protein
MRLPRPFKVVGTRLFPPWFDRLTTSGNIIGPPRAEI